MPRGNWADRDIGRPPIGTKAETIRSRWGHTHSRCHRRLPLWKGNSGRSWIAVPIAQAGLRGHYFVRIPLCQYAIHHLHIYCMVSYVAVGESDRLNSVEPT